jgi:quercetin dioxygenase-like cupin family protein
MKTQLAILSASALVAGALVFASATVAQTPNTLGAGITRADLLKHDLAIPGREVVQVRVGLASGVLAPMHTHPGDEIAYVLEGQLEYRFEGKAPVTLDAGETLFIPAGTPHSAKNVGKGNATELATYVVEKGKPLVVVK